MEKRIEGLLAQGGLCVLCTASQNKPHCSLMGCWWEPGCGSIFMVTSSQSTKYRNILENPNVSLLVQAPQCEFPPDLSRMSALTIQGVAQAVRDEKRLGPLRQAMLARHTHLACLVENPQAVSLEVKPRAFLLLEGVEEAYFEEAD